MRSKERLGVIAALTMLVLPTGIYAQGAYLPGGGAVHSSMGGVSTATPADAIGALYWNPAAIGRLGRSEISVGGAFLLPQIHLEASGANRSRTTRSDSGVGAASSLGLVYQPEESPLTFGLGMMSLGGGGVNYPGDILNPILSGISVVNNVQGPIASNLGFLQLTPMAAITVSDRLVVGFGPTVDVAFASFDPYYLAGANDANGDGVGTFPTGSHTRPFWGGGFRAGAVYSITDQIDVGFGYTSPQWFETWKFYARNEIGTPQRFTLNVSLPAIYSLGLAVRPTERLLVGADLRYFDYKNTKLFGQRLVDGGLGWDSIWAIAVGGRYQATDRIAVSAGYVCNENPIPSIGTLFNVQAPAINQHTFSVGSTMNITEALSLSLGYSYMMRNSQSGPVREATGVGVSMDSATHAATFTIQVKFGACGDCSTRCATPYTANETAAAPVEETNTPTLANHAATR
jgi:long-chain fatty acid transport protein